MDRKRIGHFLKLSHPAHPCPVEPSEDDIGVSKTHDHNKAAPAARAALPASPSWRLHSNAAPGNSLPRRAEIHAPRKRHACMNELMWYASLSQN